MHYVNTFTMKVKLDFERVPVFLRRLLNNSWRYRVTVNSVMPTEGGRGAMALESSGAPGMPPAPMPPMPMPGLMPPGAPPPSGGAATSDPALAIRKYVWLELQGEAYQFTPLRERYKSDLAGTAQPSPAPAPAGTP